MIRQSPNDFVRERAAQAKLEKISDATGGHGVEPLWLDEAERYSEMGLDFSDGAG